MNYIKDDVPMNCFAKIGGADRPKYVDSAAKLIVPFVLACRCWRCRAAMLAELIEASIRIAEELPPEARAWFDEDLRLFGENAKRLDERSKQIAAAILTGRST